MTRAAELSGWTQRSAIQVDFRPSAILLTKLCAFQEPSAANAKRVWSETATPTDHSHSRRKR